MPRVGTLSGGHFWRYQREVLKRAGRRWWNTRGKHWWVEAMGGLSSAVVSSRLGSEPSWWQPALAAIGGGSIVAFVLYLAQLATTSVLIDQEKTARIERLSGQLTDEAVARSHVERVRLYKQILLVVRQWEDLAALFEKNPRDPSVAEQVEALRTEIGVASERVTYFDVWWTDRYAVEVDAIRRALLGEVKPRAAVEELRQPIRRLAQLAAVDREWDLGRQPDDGQG